MRAATATSTRRNNQPAETAIRPAPGDLTVDAAPLYPPFELARRVRVMVDSLDRGNCVCLLFERLDPSQRKT